MAKSQTEKSRYPSRYSPGGFVTASQFIIELVCEQKARKDNKDLPARFWELDEWKTFFRSQLRMSNSLLKKYSTQAIINVIKNRHVKNLLGYNKWMIPYLDKEQKLIEQINEKKFNKAKNKENDLEEIKNVPHVRKCKSIKMNILDKLEEIDIEE